MSEFNKTTVITPQMGTILLSNKLIPTAERTEVLAARATDSEPQHEPLCVIRGYVDITAFKNKLLSLSNDMWEDDVQHSEGNVKIVRPAHDAWGVKKIIFTFCDDFMLKVVDLPWSHDEEWKALLDPIYEMVGIKDVKKQLVRCLLARMPPEMSIPVHHDTGYWVKHTHRCHVPLITNDKIDFRVGINEHCMVKTQFAEGTITELNNQAKHMVTNGNSKESNFWRVHLIFDYVDLPEDVEPPSNVSVTASHTKLYPSPNICKPELSGGGYTTSRDYFVKNPTQFVRLNLLNSDKLLQTRRTIDIRPAVPPPPMVPLPMFYILGAQKCGTTSLYEYIHQHPLVIRGKVRETHMFDWRYNQKFDDLSLPGDISKHIKLSCNAAELESKMSLAYKQMCHRKYYMSNCFDSPWLRISREPASDLLKLKPDGSLKIADTKTEPSLSSETSDIFVCGDSTPSYMLHSDVVIPRMKALYESIEIPTASQVLIHEATAKLSKNNVVSRPVRCMMMIRNPIDRAFSQYAMMIDQNGSEQQLAARGQNYVNGRSFAQLIADDMAELHELRQLVCALGFEEFTKETAECVAFSELFQCYDSMLKKISGIKHGGHSVVLRGLYFFQVYAWLQHLILYTNAQSNMVEASFGYVMISALEELSSDRDKSAIENKHKIQAKMNRVYNYLGLRSHDIEDVGAKNQRDYNAVNTGGAATKSDSTPSKLNKECRAQLLEFFHPFNRLLKAYLLYMVQIAGASIANSGLEPVLEAIDKWQ